MKLLIRLWQWFWAPIAADLAPPKTPAEDEGRAIDRAFRF